jgi:DNA invertase Pin-like site-specific DNA recombinase
MSDNNDKWGLRMDIGYMRISSEGERQTTDLQKDALLKIGVDPRNIFEDRASGAKNNRPGLEKALAFLEPGDCLIVWKLDRLGRSISHLLSIINDLNKRNIAFRSITDHIDTTTANGELLFNIFASLAQHERTLIKERVMAGLAAAKKRGRVGGRPRVIDQEKLETIIESLKSGASKASICRTYSIKRSTLYDALNRENVSI